MFSTFQLFNKVDESARRNLKRREKFKVQVHSTVKKLQVNFVENF